jgi:glucose-1-phosphate thymidylyltransferase
MKGILLAGGSGSRLFPMTLATSKMILPVYDKPTVYYPLATLMRMGLREILVISSPKDLPALRALLRDGTQWGVRLTYAVQEKPRGIADALLIAEKFIGEEPVSLILGDNIFAGHSFEARLPSLRDHKGGARVLAARVPDPQRFGVVTIDASGKALSLVEKPTAPVSDWAVTGLYVYDSGCVEKAHRLRPSSRGELEITDLNSAYLGEDALHVEQLPQGTIWIDAGTPDSLMQASQLIYQEQTRCGRPVACLEDVALETGFISIETLHLIEREYPDNAYGLYVRSLLKKR